MNNSSLLISDLIKFFIGTIFALNFLYAAWVNLVKKKISEFGADAFILLFLGKEKARRIRENSPAIRRMGMVTIIVGFSFLNATLEVFTERIWPYLR
jgi:hypothetical protein